MMVNNDQSERKLFELVSQMNFLSDIPFIFDKDIFEYDIKQANIHALLAIREITPEHYEYYSKIPKQMREVEIGYLLQSNPEIYPKMQEVIKEAKRQFVSKNDIKQSQILRIANDSIYIISPYKSIDTHIVINDVDLEFVCKNRFNTYMRLDKKVLFFLDTRGDFWNLDIKGINKDKINLHQDMLSRICNIVDARINGDKEIAIKQLIDLQNEYITKSLPYTCYRELNSDSCFRFTINNTGKGYLINSLPDYPDINSIDINYNLYILRNIYSYIMQS